MKTLLSLKAEFKTITGSDWKPGLSAPTAAPTKSTGATPSDDSAPNDLYNKVMAQGEKVRRLKSEKAAKVKYFCNGVFC